MITEEMVKRLEKAEQSLRLTNKVGDITVAFAARFLCCTLLVMWLK